MTREGWIRLAFVLNGRPTEVACPETATLLEVLRLHLGLTGTKEGCGEGECGACAVFLDGRLVNACLVLAPQVEDREVVTVEGLASESELHPVQAAFIETGAVQCGFCIPGMLMAAADIVRRHPDADRAAVRRLLAGNLCRCTGYGKIFEAVDLARRMAGRMSAPAEGA